MTGEILLLGSGIALATHLLPPLLTKPPTPGEARFAGFREELKEGPTQTTYRQRDGASAYDFWHFPLVDITADVSGEYVVEWNWVNYLDGSRGAWSEPTIVNRVALQGGQTTRLELLDNRPPETGRDPARGESIAYGDPDGILDGVWHAFKSEVTVKVISPSGATATASGVLEEVFRSVGMLVVSFAGFNIRQV